MDSAASPSAVQLDPVPNVHSNINRFMRQFSFVEPLTFSLLSCSSHLKKTPKSAVQLVVLIRSTILSVHTLERFDATSSFMNTKGKH